MPNFANRNSLFASILVDELARNGIWRVVISPGSRSTPLTLAFAAHPQMQIYSLLDERGAAFFALGQALASQKPVVLVCTSGTAAANYYPAIVEAYQSGIPLLVLTADRPQDLRESGASQTILQNGMFARHTRWAVEVPLPAAQPSAHSLRYLRSLVCRAVSASQSPLAGPVHLNLPFEKPLEPVEVVGDLPSQPADEWRRAVAGRAERQPFARIWVGQSQLDPASLQVLAQTLAGAESGVILCGPRCAGGGFDLRLHALAQTLGFAVFAEPLSGVRNASALGAYDWILKNQPAPAVILHFGAMPVSGALLQWLAKSHTSHRITIHSQPDWQDADHLTRDMLFADPLQVCSALLTALQAHQPLASAVRYTQHLQAREVSAWQVVHSLQAQHWQEGSIVAQLVAALPTESQWFVASSLAIRHVGQFIAPSPHVLPVYCNRGAAGIDGTIASAIGTASVQTDRLTVLLIGDLAFYHDQNSLLALQRTHSRLLIILFNNNGGGIFRQLPIHNYEPPFTELWLTPHGMTFAATAQQYGLAYHNPANRAEFASALAQALAHPASTLIEICTDSQAQAAFTREIHHKIKESMTDGA
ncbi:MAG TPA: 2-succinyl-5-enolpyruvyl-6-hydroxy-3-cyclohexene-1-carboxylic-acid synthase [Anaerolineales bacterium]|nr:2-succinyl-5-enolpyruvyl-6-hydroxy-3-cyclohexene-1-carboxylic-acid synthase [Anaerolineales bacterium]